MAITVYNVMPIPPDAAATRFVEAGPLRIGVEYRTLDDADLADAYGDNAAEMAEIDANKPAAGVEDEGVSIHVFGDDGNEYLRFDMFDGGPHYHYIAHSRAENVIVDYDPVALGEMLPWAIAQLRNRLTPMLERAGAASLADRVDSFALASSLDQVAALARAASESVEAQRRARKVRRRYGK
jgi:hypothetical protein